MIANPKIKAAFATGRAAFVASLPEEAGALAHTIDLAEDVFVRSVREDVDGSEDHPKFEEQGPVLAQFIITETVLAWRKTAKRRSR